MNVLGRSSNVHDQSERTRSLLREIEASAEVKIFMTDISNDLQCIMQKYCVDSCIDKAPSTNNHALVGSPCTYYKTLNHLLFISTRGNARNSGAVCVDDVSAVLTEGNVRERCWVFSNLLFKDPDFTLVHWLFTQLSSNPNRILSSPVNMRVLEKYVEKIQAHLPASSSEVTGSRGFRYAKILGTVHDVQNKKIRRPRSRFERLRYQLPEESVVPELSTREKFLLGQSFRQNEGFMPWRTGYMQWEMRAETNFVQGARRNHQQIVAGFSGHTDNMLTFTKIFKKFDLVLMTLVCILWLCGCEHHSVYEVLLTAHDHGLSFHKQDAIDYARVLLNTLPAAGKGSDNIECVDIKMKCVDKRLNMTGLSAWGKRSLESIHNIQ